MALESTQTGTNPQRTSFMNVKEFMAIGGLVGRKVAPVQELTTEDQASLVATDSTAVVRLFLGYCD